MLKLLDKLLKDFHINIQQIIKNSDNEYEDIKNEAYIVLYENYDEILKDKRVFINKLKAKCLKFNKYGKRIESAERWKYFNDKELQMDEQSEKQKEINENHLCILLDVKRIVGDDNYNFLIDYYSLGYKETSIKYEISPDLTRKRVSLLLDKIRKEMGIYDDR